MTPSPPELPETPELPESPETPETPERVWALMQSFVEAHAPRTRLRQQLGLALGTGRGKVKTLIRLAERPLSLGEIADALQVDRPYATVIVNQLETHGLVERALDPIDRRRKLVTLTRRGAEVVATARRVMDTPPAPLAALGPEELAQLGGILARLGTPS
jgi:DNA-binding MarR family transcriptional regulator